MRYDIKRNGFVVAAGIYPDSESNQQKQVMGVNIVNLNFQWHEMFQFQIGDYIDIFGERYYLNNLPDIDKFSSLRFGYKMVFQADQYSLAKSKYRFYDQNNELKLRKFEIMGTAATFLSLAVDNANRLQVGWVAGDADDTDSRLLSFDGENILQALDQIAKEFNTEWWITNRTISLIKKGSSTDYVFEYGRGKGLYSISRLNADTSSVFSRLYVRGSEKNIPADYRGGQSNLMLPDPMEFIQGTKYGADEIEQDIVFDDIFPQRIGIITSVSSPFSFTDDGIDFNINDCTYTDSSGKGVLSAKVDFLTGSLAGYQFEISKGGYNPTTKTITILKNELEKAFELPSIDRMPAIGDTYSIVDIRMPDSYITVKENELLIKGQEYFDQNASPKVSYSIEPDPLFFRDNDIELTIGDYVTIKDWDLPVNKSIRVIGLSRLISHPLLGEATRYFYSSITLADTVTGASIVRAAAEREKTNKALSLNKIKDINRARINWRNGQELLNKYFDPDGSIYSEAISPTTVRTLMIEIGAPSQQLEMPGITFTSNFEQDAAKINWTAGKLVHFIISDTPKAWDLPGGTVSELDPAKSYYVYAKCEKIGTSGSIVFEEAQIIMDSDPTYYYFWVGLANSVIDGFRNLKMLYGSVRIYGRTIEGGRIIGNLLDIDLDAGTVKGKIQMLDGSYTEGVLIVGEDGEGNAFISGITDPVTPGNSIRFGAGGEYGDLNLPFRVLDDGTVFMLKARISGDIQIGTLSGSTSDGYTDGWKLSQGAILSDGYSYPAMVGGNNFAILRGSSRYPGDKYNEFSFGTNLVPASSGGALSQVGYVKNHRPEMGSTPGLDDTTNIALELSAEGANNNIALKISKGGIQVESGEITLTGIIKISDIISGTWFYGLKVSNGMILDAGKYLYSGTTIVADVANPK